MTKAAHAMSRLQSEWHRLYLPHAPANALAMAEGQVRAMVLALAQPADWQALSVVWHAVQADLGLPAPAIVVSGVDAYQLWFSLAEAVPVAEAHAFLESLRTRYLSHIAPARISMLPAADAGALQPSWLSDMQAARQARPDQWPAFVAPDLAPVFAETPWLDMPPSPEGQADLLSSLHSIKPADWQAALAQGERAQVLTRPGAALANDRASGPCQDDPRRFLLGVMNDDTVALALRIEAAKALLPYSRP